MWNKFSFDRHYTLLGSSEFMIRWQGSPNYQSKLLDNAPNRGQDDLIGPTFNIPIPQLYTHPSYGLHFHKVFQLTWHVYVYKYIVHMFCVQKEKTSVDCGNVELENRSIEGFYDNELCQIGKKLLKIWQTYPRVLPP